jgi:hypothetical protein
VRRRAVPLKTVWPDAPDGFAWDPKHKRSFKWFAPIASYRREFIEYLVVFPLRGLRLLVLLWAFAPIVMAYALVRGTWFLIWLALRSMWRILRGTPVLWRWIPPLFDRMEHWGDRYRLNPRNLLQDVEPERDGVPHFLRSERWLNYRTKTILQRLFKGPLGQG